MRKAVVIEIPESIRKLARSYSETHPMEFCTAENVKKIGSFFESEAYDWHDDENDARMTIACRMWNVHLACDYVDQYIRTCWGNNHPLADLMVAQAFGTMASLLSEHADNTEALSAVGYLVQQVVSEAFVVRESGTTLGSGK